MSDEQFDFTKISPADGWRVLFINGNTYASLSLELHANGEVLPIDNDATFVTLGEWIRPTEEDRGDIARLQRLSEAFCRYFNSGGSWEHIEALQHRMRMIIGPGEYAGWVYHDQLVNTNAFYEHVFISAAEPKMGVVWIEDVEITVPCPWEDLERSLYAEVIEPKADEPPCRSNQLLVGQDPQVP